MNNSIEFDEFELIDKAESNVYLVGYRELNGAKVEVRTKFIDKSMIIGLGSAADHAASDFEPAKGPDDNFVTDAEKTLIGTISGKADQSTTYTKTEVDNKVSALTALATATENGLLSYTDFIKLRDLATNYVAKVTGYDLVSTTESAKIPNIEPLTIVKSWVTAESQIQANYITGKFLNAFGVIGDYAGGAVSVLDSTKMIKLVGGGVYNMTTPFVTNSSGQVLYNSDLSTIVSVFSVSTNGNAVQIGSNLVFTVDLTNKTGNFYLRLTLPYTGGVVNMAVTCVNKGNFKIGTTIKNNFRNQLNTLSDFGTCIGTYGAKTATYKISSFIAGSRLSMKFKFQNNINIAASINGAITFLNAAGAAITSFGAVRAATTQVKQAFTGDNLSYIPHPTYNSGYYVSAHNYVVDSVTQNPIVGEKLFMIWLKGSKPTTCPTQSDIESKSTWLNTYQDLCIDISTDTFSIKRDGIAVDDSQFNGGATSTIFTTSLKTGGNWKTLQALYAELVAATVAGQALENFYVEFFNLSANLTCSSIFQFGKLKLVGYYNRQVIQNTPTTDATFGYRYDAYPCYIHNNVDYREHIIDLVNDGTNIGIYVDGLFIYSILSATVISMAIGTSTSDMYFFDAEYHVGHFGDAEIVGNNIISERTPRIIGLMGHTFVDTYEGSGAVGTYAQSITRLADVTKYAKDMGYKFYSASEIASHIVGEKQLNKRAAFYMFDDANVGGYLDSTRLRNSYGQYGAVVNFAIIMNTYYGVTATINKFASMRHDRNDLVSHSKYHDVPMPNKDSVVLYWELEQMQMWAEEMHVCPNMFVYNWSGQYVPIYHMLEIKGYNCAVNSNYMGGQQSKISNRYLLGRISISDGDSNWTALSAYIV